MHTLKACLPRACYSGYLACTGESRGADFTKHPKVECARTQRTGAAARESLRRDRPGRLTSPAFHACGGLSRMLLSQ